MKIYKLDIDASKPIRKVVQMQQNSTGALSVDVSNDGKYIRNLSCALYDGDTELSAYATTDVGAGFKIDVGDETKVVKFIAKSTPIMCEWEVAIPEGNRRVQQVKLKRLQLDTGVYNQDEFYGLSKYGNANGTQVIWSVDSGTVNFKRILLQPWNTERPVVFYDANGYLIEANVPISVDSDVEVIAIQSIKCTSYTKESHTYPAVGYWTDYSLDTVIRPSENAHCYAEQEVTDPEPEPEPDPEPTPGE